MMLRRVRAAPGRPIVSVEQVGNEDAVAGGLFTTYLRHELVVETDAGDPITATGVRLLVPLSGVAGGTAVDELEVLAAPISEPPPPPPPPIDIIAEPGFSIGWDGNDGANFDAGGPPDGGKAPVNFATAGVAFSSGDLGPELGIGFHVAANLNDGFYGNANSWIGADAGVAPFHVGVSFGGTREIARVAWGRDNGNNETDACGGQCIDRAGGLYTIQVTQDGDPATTANWTTVGTVEYTPCR